VQSGSYASGITSALEAYYEAYYNGKISASLRNQLTTMLAPDAQERAKVLNEYKRLGVADVANYLNVRAEANKHGDIIGKMVRYSGCEILGESGDWYKIKSGPVTGYVSKEYIVTGDAAAAIAIQQASLRVVVTSKGNLNVRQEPSTNAKIIDKIASDERYEVEQQLKGWVKISVGVDDKGKEIYGYISSEYADVRYALMEAVEFTPVEQVSKERRDLCNYALQFLGNRYVFGGTSLTNGIDCSGFTMQIFKKWGITLPHSSRKQATMGTAISASQMKAGDLIFYSTNGRIDHVAIYIGNGKIVHAASTKAGIIISRWNIETPTKIIKLLPD